LHHCPFVSFFWFFHYFISIINSNIVLADKFESTSYPKNKLRPQRKKQPAAPGSDGPSDINRTEMPDHEIERTLSPTFDLSKSHFEVISTSGLYSFLFLSFILSQVISFFMTNCCLYQAPTSLSEIDLLDDVSLGPLFSSGIP
jgi:hypothetical protein